jgi:hypothetical protein
MNPAGFPAMAGGPPRMMGTGQMQTTQQAQSANVQAALINFLQNNHTPTRPWHNQIAIHERVKFTHQM